MSDDEGGLDRPIRIAVLGKPGAGKSSLIDLLIGQDLLTTINTPVQHHAVLLKHAPSLSVETLMANKTLRSIGLGDIPALGRADVDRVEIGLPNEILQALDIIEVPGPSDPSPGMASWRPSLHRADLLIWCTRDWTKEEQATWRNLPARFRSNSVLVVTHGDALRANRGEAELRQRLPGEAVGLFGHFAFLSTIDAKNARDTAGCIVDQAAWRDSGGDDVITAVCRAIAETTFQRRRAQAHAVQRRRRAEAMAVSSPETPKLDVEESLWASRSQNPSAASPPPSAHQAACAAVLDKSATGGTVSMASVHRDPKEEERPPLGEVLRKSLSAFPEHVALGYIDIEIDVSSRLIAAYPVSEEATEYMTKSAFGLFQSAGVRKIDDLFKSRRDTVSDAHLLKEIVAFSGHLLHIFIRGTKRPNRVLVSVSNKGASLGMVLSQSRNLSARLDSWHE